MLLNSNIIGNKNTGKTLIILHGLYGNSDSWLGVAKFLTDKFEIHLLDMRNHGKSFHSPEHTYYDMAEDLKFYTEHYKIKKTSIIGHSMGGKTAMIFADKYPDYIEKLVIADVSPRDYRELKDFSSHINFHLNLISYLKTLNPENYGSYGDFGKSIDIQDDKIKNIILKNIKKQDGKLVWILNIDAIFNNLNNIFEGLNSDDFIDKKINTEVLFIKGEESDYITRNDEKLISFIFPNSKVISLLNSGHWLHTEQPRKLAEEILVFL